jgi:AcrR family transcriptional regulator
MAASDTQASGEQDAGNGDGQQRRQASLYKRLPPGPHGLDRDQVEHHQRLRIQGAMVEAVAAGGYEATSVKQVIALAGVSRRSFYELFANKQACFLATFDRLAQRVVVNVAAGCDPSSRSLARRLTPPLQALARFTAEDPKAMTLLAAAPRLGAPGLRRLCQASAACERMLGAALADYGGALPAPVLQAIAGGAQAAIASCLAVPEASPDEAQLAALLLHWVSLFATPAANPPMLQPRAAPGTGRGPPVSAGGAGRTAPAPETLRARLLDSSLRLVADEGMGELTMPRIADQAGVPVDAVLDTFASAEECFVTALADAADGLLVTVQEQTAHCCAWPGTVRVRMAALLGRLAARPLHARAVAELAFVAGEQAASDNLERLRELAAALTGDAPQVETSQLPPAVALDMTAGALLHTLRCQVMLERVGTLPLLADQLAFVVMAPRTGAERAAAALEDAR